MDPIWGSLGAVWLVGVSIYIYKESKAPKVKRKVFHNAKNRIKKTKKDNEVYKPTKKSQKVF